ncbi:MAG: hypothetical protein JO263_01185 [Candidatus Eremiobacteraeota bacterium]|nr:hypothetical protein [Candidatus Eremiobacteraeota bacterium]
MRATIPAIALFIAVTVTGCQGGAQHGGLSLLPADRFAPASSSYVMIHSFTGPPLGELPEANPIIEAPGGLYGTTMRGGTMGACSQGCGTIFRLSHSKKGWSETTLASFDLTHGAYPNAALVADASGNLYGATSVGGNLGVAYELLQGARRLRVLHNFQGGSDGQQPESNLIFDRSGKLYGTTVSGGDGGSGGGGTVYELSPSGRQWAEKILYRFPAYYQSQGANPYAGVIFGRGGTLYGTTAYGGGSPACGGGCGVAYELTPAGKGSWKESVLHAFDKSDGAVPVANLIPDARGNLYGSANAGGLGGCQNGCGTLFALARAPHGRWSFSIIYDFQLQTGAGPSGNMVFDASGNLYGTTVIGGTYGWGVVFKLAPQANHKWTYSVLHAFSSTPDGAEPSGLVRSADGRLYGTTIGGGASGLGTVFELKP